MRMDVKTQLPVADDGSGAEADCNSIGRFCGPCLLYNHCIHRFDLRGRVFPYIFFQIRRRMVMCLAPGSEVAVFGGSLHPLWTVLQRL